MTKISLRMEDADALLFKEYVSMKQMTVSELIRKTVIECISEEFDLRTYKGSGGIPRQLYLQDGVGELLEVTP